MSESQNVLESSIKNILNLDLQDIIKDDIYINFKQALIIKLKNLFLSEEFKAIFYKFAEEKINLIEKENKNLKEILPKGFENTLKVLVYNKSPKISSAIKEFINSDKFTTVLKHEVVNFTSGMNPMLQKFINVDSIYSKLMRSSLNYIDNPETIMSIVMGINNKIDEGIEKSITEFSSCIPYEGKISLIKALVDSILDSLSEDIFIQTLFDKIEEKALKYNNLGALFDTIIV